MNTKLRKTIKIIAIIIGLLAGVVAIYFYFSDIKEITKETKDFNGPVAKDSIEYELIDSTGINLTRRDKVEKWLITGHKVGNLAALGDDVYGAIRKLKKTYNVTEIEDGPDEGDLMYVIKDGDKPMLTIKRNSTGYISDIMVHDTRFHTESGINVGTAFTVLFNKFPKGDMRFGDIVDGVNNINSGEMFKAAGMLFVHLVPEDSPRSLATYDYKSMTFKIKNWNNDERVNEIIVSTSIW